MERRPPPRFGLKPALAVGLSAVYMATQVVFAQAAESNFWDQRAQAVRRVSGVSTGPWALPAPVWDVRDPLATAPPPARGDPAWPADLANLARRLGAFGAVRVTGRGAPGKPVVIHIQDVHGDVPAQKTIAAALLSIGAERPETPWVLEGAAGTISLDGLRGGDPLVNRRAGAFFFNAGLIGGAEYAAFAAARAPRLFGAEDPRLYRANVRAVRSAAARRAAAAERLSAEEARLSAFKAAWFTPALKALDARSRAWDQGTEGLGEKIDYLTRQPVAPPVQAYPELKLFCEARRAERSLDLAAAQRERAALLDVLARRLPAKHLESFTRHALAFRAGQSSPGDFYGHFRGLVARSGLVLSRFPALDRYVRYVIDADAIRPEALRRELNRYESAVWAALCRTPAQRELWARTVRLERLKGLARLSLTPEEWAAHVAGGTPWARPFEDFYRAAEARNAALARRVMGAFPAAPAGERPVAVLVAGGFHSHGLERIFRENGVTVLTLTPRLETGDGSDPFALFIGSKTPLERLFEAPRVSLAPELAVAPVDAPNPRADAVRALAGPLNSVLAGGPPAKVPAPGGRVEVSLAPDGIPASLGDGDPQAPRVAVRALPPSLAERLRNGLRTPAGRVVKVVLLALTFLTAAPLAQAYTLVTPADRPGQVFVGVQRGETLSGAAAYVLKQRGEKLTPGKVAGLVKELAALNGLKNPHLIQPGRLYRIPDRAPAPFHAAASPPVTVPQAPLAAPSSAALLAVPSEGQSPPRADALGIAAAALSPLPTASAAPAAPAWTTRLPQQWPTLAALIPALLVAFYFLWWRRTDVNLTAVETGSPAMVHWRDQLDRAAAATAPLTPEEGSLALAQAHFLVVKHRLTEDVLKNPDTLRDSINAHRALSRLCRDTVRLLDGRRAGGAGAPLTPDGQRLVDIREKLFLYQLYALKMSHALVPVTAAHWALSYFDRDGSWFERLGFGPVLRRVRGVRRTYALAVEEFEKRLFETTASPEAAGGAQTVWDITEGLSVTALGEVLSSRAEDRPSTTAEWAQQRDRWRAVFREMSAAQPTKSDASLRDLHRKGMGIFITIVFFASLGFTNNVSFLQGFLTFLTALGIPMVLFRLESMGIRRDTFYRDAVAEWRAVNRQPHHNGALKSATDAHNVGPDPFHLTRDFCGLYFKEAQAALAAELKGDYPSADLVVLVARNPTEAERFKALRQQSGLFRSDVPVMVLTVEAPGSLFPYAQAALVRYSDEFKQLPKSYPSWKDKAPGELRQLTLISKDGQGNFAQSLPGVPSLREVLPRDVGDASLLSLAVMNGYRATQDLARQNLGGHAFRWADRAYLGPVRAGPGVTLDAQWASAEDMDVFQFGAVVEDSSGTGIRKLVRRPSVPETRETVGRMNPDQNHASSRRLKQYRGFSGEGTVGFSGNVAEVQRDFFQKFLEMYNRIEEPKPPFNLVTGYLIPQHIGTHTSDRTKITTYFSQSGFLEDPHSIANLELAGYLKQLASAVGAMEWRLNQAPVDGSFYGGVDNGMEIQPAFPTSAMPPKDKTGGLARVFAGRGGAAVLLLLFMTPLLSAGVPPPGETGGLWSGLLVLAAAAGLVMPPVLRRALASLGRKWTADLHGVDVTERVWENPARSLRPLAGLYANLPSRQQAVLARVLLSLTVEDPLRADFLAGLDARVLRQRYMWRERAAREQPFSPGRAVAEDVVLRSLGHQLALVVGRRGQGAAVELRQAAVLMGLSGRWTRQDARDFLGAVARAAGVRPLGRFRLGRAWREGRAGRALLRLEEAFPAAPVLLSDRTLTAVRVNELIDTPDSPAGRAVLAQLKARRSHARAAEDILVVNGVGKNQGQADSLRENLLRALPLEERDLQAYVPRARLVVLPAPRFSADQVLEAVFGPEHDQPSLRLYTADAAAVSVNPLATAIEVFLLSLFPDGRVRALDIGAQAQEALKRGRVLSSAA